MLIISYEIWEYADKDIYLYLSIYLARYIDNTDDVNIDTNIDMNVGIDVPQVKNIVKFKLGIDKFIKTNSPVRCCITYQHSY